LGNAKLRKGVNNKMNEIKWLNIWIKKHWVQNNKNKNLIKIGTLDNPGWCIKINIIGTELENKNFKDLELNRDENNWLFCRVKNGIFEGFGGINNLMELIHVFQKWTINISDFIK
jgi:hypothetical protein